MISMHSLQQFLLACIQENATELRADVLPKNPKEEDLFLAFILFHGVLPCLPLECFDPHPALQSRIHKELSQLKHKSFQMTALLLQLNHALMEKDIPIINIKGAVLGEHAYGDYTLRPFSDIDILIQEDKLVDAAQTLLSLGYRNMAPKASLTHPFILEHFVDVAFEHIETGLIVELHWQLLRHVKASLRDIPSLFHHAYTVNIQGLQLKSLPLEEEFVYLCIHAAKHRFERLEWLNDLARLFHLHHTDYRFEKMLEIAREEKYLKAYLLALFFLQRDFEVIINEPQTQNLLKHARLDPLIQRIETFQASVLSINHTGRVRLKDFAFAVALEDGMGRKLQRLISLIFPLHKADILMSRPLPRALYVMYYLYRPFRLLSTGFSSTNHKEPFIDAQ